MAATITGRVFEDVNYGGGPGRSYSASSGAPLANVRVEIYDDDMDYVTAVTTNAAGVYTYSYGGHALRYVRVVNGTVRSTRSAGSTCTTCVPVQTFRTRAPSGSVIAVVDRVGGEDASRSDAASNASSDLDGLTITGRIAQSVSEVDPSSSNATVSGVDFGFNFSTIVNTRDATSCAPSSSGNTFYPCQGSLRQFVINANALGGESSLAQAGSRHIDQLTSSLPGGYESSIFMVPSTSLTSGVAVINLVADLPTLSSPRLRLDATTQTVNIGNTNPGSLGTGGTVGASNVMFPTFARPEVEIGGGHRQITLPSNDQSIVGFALPHGYIVVSGTNTAAINNLVGMTASGSSTSAGGSYYGITFSGTNALVHGNFVTVNNSAIRGDTPASGALIRYNEVARPQSGHSNTFDGILLIGSASSIVIENNLARDQAGGGIELGFEGGTLTNIRVENNTVQNNGFTSGTTPSAEPLGLVSHWYTGNNVQLVRNRVINNAGPGLLIMRATGTLASQNVFSNNGHIAIDLDPRTGTDPNTHGAINGVTLNDANDSDTGPNGLLNYPVFESARIIGGQLQLRGYARPNSTIELYIAQADPTGFGEGLAYLTTLSEGSAADLDTTTGMYGPGPINGLNQGTDTTARFAFNVTVPAGVTIGTTLTATASLSGQTSEFGGNLVVQGAPALTHLKSVQVISDPINIAANPKSIPGAMQLYTVRVTNTGPGGADSNSMLVSDAVPANTSLYVADVAGPGSGPITFLQGTPSSGLTWTFGGLGNASDDVEFSSDGGLTWTYTPAANAHGCDPAVTHLRMRPKGAMNASGGGSNPWFELRFRVRVD